MNPPTRRPVLLIILDGWGSRTSSEKNAISLANTPTFRWLDRYARKTTLKASGTAVGLPPRYQGNSEVGHITIGAGRIIKEVMVSIDDAIKKKTFFSNNALCSAISNAKKNNTALHIMGLVQNEGVHAVTRHATALLQLAKKYQILKVWLHIFSDGRDTPPKSAIPFVNELLSKARQLHTGIPATLTGRYFAMDRDTRWNRTKKAFDAIVSGKGIQEKDPISAIYNAYSQGETDEFISPRIFPGYTGIQPHDSIIFFNYRLDRARQLTHALTDTKFSYFPRIGLPLKNKSNRQPSIHVVTMTRYYRDLPCPVAFENQVVKNNLGRILSNQGLRQLRIGETEKYAHVTYFFNSEVEKPYPGEKRILIPSPKVATYDVVPEMSAKKITAAATKEIQGNTNDIIIMNFANGDMVGHTGNLKATIKAVECVDHCVGALIQAVKEKGGVTIITADHGNCEDMRPAVQTSHTRNDVPFYLIGNGISDVVGRGKSKNAPLHAGGLQDVAPTLLKILGIQKPKEMTGRALFKEPF